MFIPDSVLDTFTPIQNATGGFGGGHGQYSHLATTYAAVLSLIIVGGQKALDMVDRKSMWVRTAPLSARLSDCVCRWEWLGSLKQPEGDIAICVGGEKDVRFVSKGACDALGLTIQRSVLHNGHTFIAQSTT